MLLDPTLTAAYIVLATALAIAPGPDVLFVVANGMQHKIKGAIASAMGIAAGTIVHAFAAAAGISAMIAASPLAFNILRYAGALYLTYLGLKAIYAWYLNSDNDATPQPSNQTKVSKVFWQGFVTNLLNPKVVVFYLALLPQFVNTELGNVGLQVFLLGCIHNAIGLTFLLGVGITSGRASDWLNKTSVGRWLDGIAGVFFVGLALRLAFSEKPAE